MTALLVRQRELVKQLDLDKDEARIAGLDGEAMRQAAYAWVLYYRKVVGHFSLSE